MKIFQKLQLKFVLIPLAIGGMLLAIVFSTIFGITYYGVDKTAQQCIIRTLGYKIEDLTDLPLDRNSCIAIVKIDDFYKFYNTQFYPEEMLKKIIDTAINEESFNYNIDNHSFKMGYTTSIIGEHLVKIYAIYDCTDDYTNLKRLGISLSTIYIISLIALSLISYAFSLSAVKPIKNAFYKQQELVANASHELKTPLTVITTNLDLVSNDKAIGEENKKWLDSARYQLSRMNNLVLQMLELSSLESPTHSEKITFQNINFSELCEGILLSFEAVAFEKMIIIDSEVEKDIFYSADKTELEKLVTIIVDNAIKYTPNNGKITFKLFKDTKNIIANVTNYGIGMTQEETEKVFERFYKLDPSHKESGNSFGLGLSIAKSIADSMNGDIICKSELDKYTTFEIILPV